MPKHPVTAYAERVASGKLPAGTLHRLACERHLLDLQASAYRVVPKEATQAIEFFPRVLRHYKGEQRQIGRSPVMEHEEKQARSPHWRRGHFRVLQSEKYTHKRGQTVFVKGTFVRGTAFDILDDAPAARNGATP